MCNELKIYQPHESNTEAQNYDIERISRDESFRVSETACALANSSGGLIVCDGFDPARFIPSEIPYISDSPGKIYIPPLIWHKKPATFNSRVYRRIEGQNVISGLRAKIIMADDAHEPSRDDTPTTAGLNDSDMAAFVERVITRRQDMSSYPRDEILRRCGVYSGKYLTFAGALMLGDMLRLSAVLEYYGGREEISAVNIWRAYTEILPRLTRALSEKCAHAFREMFINSLLHADYNIDTRIDIRITSSPPTATADNPGIIRWAVRNHRLAKMFALSGITGGRLHGLDIIHSYMPDFTLTQNMLDFRTISTLLLEGRADLPEPVML